MSTQKTLKGLTAVAAGALLAVGSAGVAHAQNTVTVVPGDNGDGRTVIVNQAGMDVEVVSVDRAAGTAQVTMTNNLGFPVYCEAPNQDAADRFGGSISTAPVVEQSVEYYQRFQNVKAEEVRITMTVAGSTNTMVVALWPLLQFLPKGSVGDMASPAIALRSQISDANVRAKVKGLYGTTPAFALNNGATVTRNITLGPPSTQPRGTDKVGYFTMCAANPNTSAGAQGNGQLYAWSAYEEGWPPDPVVEPESTGSLDAGSLGGGNGAGSAASSGSTGSNGDAGTPSDPDEPVDPGDTDPAEPPVEP